MQFLRTLFWALLVGLAVAFAFNNWVSVDVRLWGGLVAQINLPVLLLLTFLLGFVPVYLLYRTSRWRMRQRLAASERNVMELRNAAQLPAFPPETAPPGPVEPREDPDMLPLGAPPADAR
ncbi:MULTISPECIES: lipopolysaccharide assembly protein LapA domain-containing protein [unclassified Sphingomonas]|jgi:hypothetical protein|uniref:lipopolysaccharide assembly protein LapA domain-containing protein n=1 Tax=unclassified Sphingomonas TaxID=196159 RepID=UPI000836B2CA|nr:MULTISPECIES: lipopolysaccharide assembly protein LapA domain-containing protein [unclassified Sphingomonas]